MSAPGASGRRAPRTIEVTCPAWSDAPFGMREPTVKEYLSTVALPNDQERAVAMLGFMVLDERGKSVGKEAILAAPLPALGALSMLIPKFTGEADSEVPLEPTSASDTA